MEVFISDDFVFSTVLRLTILHIIKQPTVNYVDC